MGTWCICRWLWFPSKGWFRSLKVSWLPDKFRAQWELVASLYKNCWSAPRWNNYRASSLRHQMLYLLTLRLSSWCCCNLSARSSSNRNNADQAIKTNSVPRFQACHKPIRSLQLSADYYCQSTNYSTRSHSNLRCCVAVCGQTTITRACLSDETDLTTWFQAVINPYMLACNLLWITIVNHPFRTLF